MNNSAEVKNAVLQEIDNIAMRQVSHSKPLYTLEDILLSKNITKLRKLGRIHKISRYTKMDKNELASSIKEEISDIEYLQEILMIINSAEFEEFCIAAKSSQYICTGVVCAKLDFLKSLGIAELYYFDNSFIAVIPTEIKDSFNELVATGFIDRKKRFDLLNNYVSAAVNLYGVISQDDFVELFNSQNRKKTDVDEVFQTLTPYITQYSNYCFWKEYIVNDIFKENEFKDVKYLLSQIAQKPRFIPNKQELLEYSDGEYYEETPQTKELLRYLKSVADPIDAEDIAHDLCLACTYDKSISDFFDILGANGIKFKDIPQVQKMTDLLSAVSNNTRKWANKGHTPNELAKKFASPNISPLKSSVKTVKIGRNSPCPCGSGKKYKRCCGK